MKNSKEISKGIVMISQIGITMITPVLLCIFIGYQLDKKFSTDYWFIIFLVLGFITSIRNVYFLTKQFYAKDKEREDKELKYIEDLKRQGRLKKKEDSGEGNK
ncbi:MAG: AtpZ/AtpI family protein [bacterium]|nr:AtpZ/AtpI family protein [bacterium]